MKRQASGSLWIRQNQAEITGLVSAVVERAMRATGKTDKGADMSTPDELVEAERMVQALKDIRDAAWEALKRE